MATQFANAFVASQRDTERGRERERRRKKEREREKRKIEHV